MKKTVNISLEEIIKRYIQFHLNDNEEEMINENKGYVRGFEELLCDMNLSEDEFVKKYYSKVKELAKIFDEFSGEKPNEYIEELSGYNDAIVEVLMLLDKNYMYDRES